MNCWIFTASGRLLPERKWELCVLHLWVSSAFSEAASVFLRTSPVGCHHTSRWAVQELPAKANHASAGEIYECPADFSHQPKDAAYRLLAYAVQPRFLFHSTNFALTEIKYLTWIAALPQQQRGTGRGGCSTSSGPSWCWAGTLGFLHLWS